MSEQAEEESCQPSNNQVFMGGWHVDDWKELREQLRDASCSDGAWKTAAEYLQQRLTSRYLDAIHPMRKDSTGPGFSAVTLLCILIEHLAAVERGKIFWADRSNRPYRGYDYSDNAKLYQGFLKESGLLRAYFSADTGEPGFSAKDFYQNVRCALVHEACTKNNWVISTNHCREDNWDSTVLRREADGVKRIYRDYLFDRVKEYLASYVMRVTADRQLQLALARKLDSLCEIKPTWPTDRDVYEWWSGLQPPVVDSSVLATSLKNFDTDSLLKQFGIEMKRRIETCG